MGRKKEGNEKERLYYLLSFSLLSLAWTVDT